MNNNLTMPSSEAEQYCLQLMEVLDKEKRLDFASSPAPADGGRPDPRLSTAPLFGEARGQMFGVLVCGERKNSNGNSVILKAFSGQYNGIWEVPGWVPPLLDPAVFREAVRKADPAIKKLTAEIGAGTDNRAQLVEERRQLSQRHMREIHEMYTIRNFAGEYTDLFSLFAGRPGIPAGTGDCCAPKLLDRAIELGLQPVSLAEFYWGRENRSGTRKHRSFYPPCEEKCSLLLNFMLRGTEFAG